MHRSCGERRMPGCRPSPLHLRGPAPCWHRAGAGAARVLYSHEDGARALPYRLHRRASRGAAERLTPDRMVPMLRSVNPVEVQICLNQIQDIGEPLGSLQARRRRQPAHLFSRTRSTSLVRIGEGARHGFRPVCVGERGRRSLPGAACREAHHDRCHSQSAQGHSSPGGTSSRW
jgi:hypothetical protein